MNNTIYRTMLLAICMLLIGYGQAQRFEGNSCTLYDGSRGICKNIDHCETIKEGLRLGKLRYEQIVGCSFMGSVQIACCADERPLPGRNQPSPPSSTTTDFVFINMRERSTTKRSNMLPWMEDILNEYSTTQNSNRNRNKQNVRTTTPTSIRKTTTINSFWHDWSATQSNDIWQTTTDQPELDPWMKDILDEHTTTPTPNLKDNYVQTPLVVTEMPSWMRQVLNGYSSTTARNGLPLPIQFESSNTKESTFGGGIGGGIDFGGGMLNFGANIGVLHQSTKHSNDNDSSKLKKPTEHVTKTPFSTDSQTNSRYGTGSKAEAACELYSTLAPDTGIAWKILGGSSAGLGEFPWMAALGFDTDDRSFDCGGTIISEYFILTAAHCTPSRRRPIKVRLGKVTLFTNDDDAIPVDLSIQEIIQHPDYKASTKKNDVALIRVAERIKFNEYVRPACLQTDLNDVLPNVELYVTGWGSTSAERTVRPSVLLKTNVTSMPLSICNSTLFDYNRQINQPSLRYGISESQCCAFDSKAKNDACQGDSGGPLQTFSSPAIGTIVGVVSFGISCGTSLPGVYTRVAYYIDWIESIVWPNSVPGL